MPAKSLQLLDGVHIASYFRRIEFQLGVWLVFFVGRRILKGLFLFLFGLPPDELQHGSACLKELPVVPEEELVVELVPETIRLALYEVVHVQLRNLCLTCLTNELMLLCLKYLGRMSFSNRASSWMMNPEPLVPHSTM